MGDYPSEQDCAVFSVLAQFYWSIPGPLHKLVKGSWVVSTPSFWKHIENYVKHIWMYACVFVCTDLWRLRAFGTVYNCGNAFIFYKDPTWLSLTNKRMNLLCLTAYKRATANYTLRPRQNGHRFADDTFNSIFLNENVRISIKISLKFVPKGPINNNPVLVQIKAWRRSGDKPLSEPMMVSLLTHICVTRPQWVKWEPCVYYVMPTVIAREYIDKFEWEMLEPVTTSSLLCWLSNVCLVETNCTGRFIEDFSD